jgi:hypothetical protein
MENIDNILDDDINTTEDDTNEEQSIQEHKQEEENGVVETKCPPKTIEKAKKPKTKAQQEAWARCLAGRREAVERRKREKAKLNEKIKKIKKEPIVLSEDEVEEPVSEESEDEPEPVVIVKKKRKKIEKKKKPKVQYVYETDEDTDNTDDEDYEPSPPPQKRKSKAKKVESESEDDETPQQNNYENLDWRSRARLRGF